MGRKFIPPFFELVAKNKHAGKQELKKQGLKEEWEPSTAQGYAQIYAVSHPKQSRPACACTRIMYS